MQLRKDFAAAAELLLIAPAVLFMTALFVRNLQPLKYEPAHTAQQIVNWYAARLHVGLWICLMALPLAVLVIGAATLWFQWRNDTQLREDTHEVYVTLTAHLATGLIAAATLIAAGVLAIVALHVLSD